jgi:hypothetical protein
MQIIKLKEVWIMTRKSKKGIVGKGEPTLTQRKDIGPGISFTDENLISSDEIEREILRRKDQ